MHKQQMKLEKPVGKNVPVATFLQVKCPVSGTKICSVLFETEECKSGKVLLHELLYISQQFGNEIFGE